MTSFELFTLLKFKKNLHFIDIFIFFFLLKGRFLLFQVYHNFSN